MSCEELNISPICLSCRRSAACPIDGHKVVIEKLITKEEMFSYISHMVYSNIWVEQLKIAIDNFKPEYKSLIEIIELLQ